MIITSENNIFFLSSIRIFGYFWNLDISYIIISLHKMAVICFIHIFSLIIF